MILELVTFARPEGFSDADLRADARGTVAHWQANADLLAKRFATFDEGRQVAGIYLWPDRAAAERAHDAAWIARFQGRTGQHPGFAYFDVFMEIDNEKGTVTEFAFPGDG